MEKHVGDEVMRGRGVPFRIVIGRESSQRWIQTRDRTSGRIHGELIESDSVDKWASLVELVEDGELLDKLPLMTDHDIKPIEVHNDEVVGSSKVDPSALMKLVWPTLIDLDGCVLLSQESDSMPDIRGFYDRTDMEAFFNHVHLNDLFVDEVGRSTGRFSKSHCLFVAEMWMVKLRFEYPRRRFLVYLFMDGEDAHLRFHTYRPKEYPWGDIDLVWQGDCESVRVWFV